MSVKRPALLVGGAILTVIVGAAGAWLTLPPDKSRPRGADASKAGLAVGRAAKPAASIAIPQAEVPPAPTSADFAAAAPKTGTAKTAAPATEAAAVDWTAVPIDELRTRANADELPAMEEMARRLVQGAGVPKDQQAGAGWLLRAAKHGSAQSAFNVGVMYERGFIVERDSTRAVEWYRKAVAGNVALAKHNLALMLREGKGVPRDGQEAVSLLRSASRQGMAASMFALGDIYERGDVLPKDAAMALAWYAVAAEFERQTNRGGESALGKTAAQRAQLLQHSLLPGDLERAQQAGQAEFKQIVEALQPPKPPPPLLPSTLPPAALPAPALPAPVVPVPAPAQAGATPPLPPTAESDPPGWPKAANDHIRVIQQALVDLKLLRDKPDGAIGPVTRAAIRAFQQSIGARETGEPTKDVFAALMEATARREAAASAPPTETTSEPPKTESPLATIDVGTPEPPPAPPTSADIAPAAAKPETPAEPKPEAPQAPAVADIDLGTPEPPPAPPTSADIARAMPVTETTSEAKVEPKSEAAKEAAAVAPTKIDPPKPPMPTIEAATPAPPAIVIAPEPSKPAPAAATIDVGQPEPPPAPPTSADIARAGPDPWPASTADQVTAIQSLLRDLNFSRDPPDGVYGPATRAAILDYERTAGLSQTGEPSKALFESLKAMREAMVRKSLPSSP